jgi:hypothetical protein
MPPPITNVNSRSAEMRAMLYLLVLCLLAAPLAAQAPERAIRRTIPITRGFARALEAGSRDSSGTPTARYWQLKTDYTISAKLDPATSTVTGIERITLTNPSADTLKSVALRLYQNLFAPNVARSSPVAALTSGLTISSLVANGDSIAISPDWDKETVAQVKLATPILPGGTGTFGVVWSFQVPKVPEGARGDRMGSWGTRLFQVAQWYPQIAVYDDLSGWNTDPYLGDAEFFNNFGSFDVKLDVPAGWLIGATGVLRNADSVLAPAVRQRLARATSSDSQIVVVGPDDRGAGKATATGDRLVWHFTADSVADFAWATSSEFLWDATRATIPGKGVIPISILYLPEHARYKQTGAYARHALEYYSKLWMPYAFPAFTQVDGPENGMEYPSLTFSGPGFGVTDHEIGHQWWPMMVGVNETWYGWMDEGFNQYMNMLSGAAFRDTTPRLNGTGRAYQGMPSNEREPPMMWDANYDGPMYGFVTYGKAPLMLSMLGAIVGDSAVQRAMSGYAHAWRFKHPSPWDYMFYMDKALNRDLGWFWNAWLFETAIVDNSITDVTTKGAQVTVKVHQDGDMPSPVVLDITFSGRPPSVGGMKNAKVSGNTIRVTWPVDVWFDGRRTFDAVMRFSGQKIVKVVVDPDARFPDSDQADNVWPRSGSGGD